jgi:hypothetical protein
MKFSELYKILQEASSIGGSSGYDVKGDTAAPGFIGRGGQEIDGLYGGGFYPSKKDLMFLLQMQVDDRIELEDWNKKVTPIFDLLYKLVPGEAEKLEKLWRKDKPDENPTEKSNNLKNIVYSDTGYENYSDRKEQFVDKNNGWKEIYSEL